MIHLHLERKQNRVKYSKMKSDKRDNIYIHQQCTHCTQACDPTCNVLLVPKNPETGVNNPSPVTWSGTVQWNPNTKQTVLWSFSTLKHFYNSCFKLWLSRRSLPLNGIIDKYFFHNYTTPPLVINQVLVNFSKDTSSHICNIWCGFVLNAMVYHSGHTVFINKSNGTIWTHVQA